MKTCLALLLVLIAGLPVGNAEPAIMKRVGAANRRVIVITLDGFRWQELFSGADTVLLEKAMQQHSNKDLQQFAGKTGAIRRQKLMPFLWKVVADKGQLMGNRLKGSKVNITNPFAISYAGYNELFTGRPDQFLWNNKKKKNSHQTILEYLNKLPHFRGKVGSVASWDAFPSIFNKERSGIWINAGNLHPEEGDVRNDSATFAAARAYLLEHRPMVMHIGLGGTDEAGHSRRYDKYLRQAHLADYIIGRIWQLVQSLPEYQGHTTFIITTDHGRGNGRRNWHQHGTFVRGSSQTWIAMLGSGIAAGGESKDSEQLYGSQLAGTIGFLLQQKGYRSYTLPLTKLTGLPQEKDIARREVSAP
jgi:hypothetical protein